MNKKVDEEEELKQLILNLSDGIINDCLTFSKLRLHHNPIYKSLNSGGGNFLMALGLLSILGFLAKIYITLADPKSVIDEIKNKELKTFKADLAKMAKVDKKLLNSLVIPRAGSINEEDAFVRLINKVQDDNIAYLGLNDSSARIIWKIYRNKLAHLTVPLAPVGVYDQDMSHLSWVQVEHEVSKQGTFLVKGNLILCNSDKLVQNAKTIRLWLCTYIDTLDKKTIANALRWLKFQLT